VSPGCSNLNGCFTSGFQGHGLLPLSWHLLMVAPHGRSLSVAVLTQSKCVFVFWQMAELYFPQAALGGAVMGNEKAARVVGKKGLKLERANEESWEELNGVKGCSLGERAQGHRHASSMAAKRYSHFFFAIYVGWQMCNSKLHFCYAIKSLKSI